jgi:hypothetical protein
MSNVDVDVDVDPGRVFKPIFCYMAQDITYRAQYDCLNVCRMYNECIGRQWPAAREGFRL